MNVRSVLEPPAQLGRLYAILARRPESPSDPSGRQLIAPQRADVMVVRSVVTMDFLEGLYNGLSCVGILERVQTNRESTHV